MRIVALSDTHAEHRSVTVPDGDVLVFAGDLMTCGRKMAEVMSFAEWFCKQPHKHKILVAGNHDRLFENRLPLCLVHFHGVTYLQDSGVTIDGVKFWGSPWQPWFHDWAFNVHRGEAIKKYWDKISEDTNVLITHGPPYGILDQLYSTQVKSTWGHDLFIAPSEHLGCEELQNAVARVKPKAHIFGHIHGSYGTDKILETQFYNVAICDEQYQAVNSVTTIEV